MTNLKVNLGPHSYPIFIGEGILAKLGEMLKLYNLSEQVVVITDDRIHQLYGQKMRDSLNDQVKKFDTIVLPEGESTKSLANVEKIITRMLELGCERGAAVLAFGGGVIGDLAGFAASIYKRGVPLVQAPTTLLAQVDASIGGKTGVNHPLGKNMIGTFYQPKLVWSDLALLKTLPRKEIICGLGEIIKYGVIRDLALFTLVEQNLEKILALDLTLLQEIVTRCCEIKARIVAADEKERDLRMILNFGHTIGHALEAALEYTVTHGEAVLLGMLAESKIALDLGTLSTEEFNRIRALILRLDVHFKIKDVNKLGLYNFMQADKKTVQGKVQMVLPKKIGEVFVADKVEKKTIDEGIDALL